MGKSRHDSALSGAEQPQEDVTRSELPVGYVHKAHQQHHFDHEVGDPEFEITRPRGGGRFYTFLMNYKVGTALGLLGESIAGRSVLDVCSGSGMDAELLLSHGPDVVCLDISERAIARAAERAHRYALNYRLVVGDVENLPFPDRAFDYVFVHDGLHHLDDPERAIAEMARVSRRGVVITEPADALLTGLLVRTGLLPELEESGNVVRRLHPRRLRALFDQLGPWEVRHRRYLVKYPHQPGRLFRLLDLPGIFTLGELAFLLLGVHLFGPTGNKLAFVALARNGVSV